MLVCTYVCKYVSMHISMDACMYVSISPCMHVCINKLPPTLPLYPPLLYPSITHVFVYVCVRIYFEERECVCACITCDRRFSLFYAYAGPARLIA
jgi:hypothetical protein